MSKNLLSFYIYHFFINLLLTSAAVIVWDEYIDICKFNETYFIEREPNRCENSADIMVEKRLYRDEEPYWCIAINNTLRKYSSIEILFDGGKTFRKMVYTKYFIVSQTIFTNNEGIEKLQLGYGIPRIVIYPSNSNYALQKIVSIKLDNVEMCDQSKSNEIDLIYNNQENTNLQRYFNKCLWIESRIYRLPKRCELLDEIIVEELVFNANILFYCIIVDKTSRTDSNLDGIDDLHIELANDNFLITRTKYTKIVSSTSTKLTFLLTKKVHRMAIAPRRSASGVPHILSVKINSTESCQKRIESNEPIQHCGAVKIKHRGLITFGDRTYHGQFPWHIALYETTSPVNTNYICGGTIVSFNAIITAAHCIKNEHGLKSIDILRVQVGKFDLTKFNEDTKEYLISKVIPHPEFQKDYLENDIAILKLKSHIQYSDYIQPICLLKSLEEEFFTNKLGSVPGWGRTELDTTANVLNYAKMPIASHQDCRRSKRDFFSTFLNENNFCAGLRNGTSVCTGDSGGGLIFETESGWVLKGIVSLGVAVEGACDITEYILFTDATKYFNWIYNVINFE